MDREWQEMFGNLFGVDPQNTIQTSAKISHKEESLSHKCITEYEARWFTEDMLGDSEIALTALKEAVETLGWDATPHALFEAAIRRNRESRDGTQRLTGLSEERASADPDGVRRLIARFVMGRLWESLK